jgi:hypothetical protein
MEMEALLWVKSYRFVFLLNGGAQLFEIETEVFNHAVTHTFLLYHETGWHYE